MTRRSLLLAAALLAAGNAQAAGSTALGGAFDAVGIGTRPLGMGGAFVALADDANAVQENPAGMAFFDKAARFATFTHSNLFGVDELSRDFVAYAQADAGYSAFGLAWNRFAANLDPENWTEDAFTYAGARLVSTADADTWPKLAVGWQAKYLRVDSSFSETVGGGSVGGGTASGYGVSLGILARLRPSLSIGIMAQDLYSSISWATGTLEIIPMTGRAGATYRLTDTTSFSAEGRGTQGSSGFGFSSWHLGGEHWLFDGKSLMWNTVRNVAVRGGYYQQVVNNDSGVFSAGATAKADQWQIDYTYQFGLSQQQLGASHRIGLGMTF
jgi:hypothetical protein